MLKDDVYCKVCNSLLLLYHHEFPFQTSTPISNYLPPRKSIIVSSTGVSIFRTSSGCLCRLSVLQPLLSIPEAASGYTVCIFGSSCAPYRGLRNALDASYSNEGVVYDA